MSMSERTGGIGLEYLSVFGMALPDYVALAAKLGCDFVSVTFGKPANAACGRGETLRESADLRRTLASSLGDHGLRLEQVEGFGITPDRGVDHYAHDLDAIAELGARSICAVSIDQDIGRTKARFIELADMAQERGILLTTEVGAGVICDFERGRLLWSKLGHSNFALLLDTMHFFGTGAIVEHLDAAPEGMIGHIQLCDANLPELRVGEELRPILSREVAQIQKRAYLDQALHERCVLGEGDLPLAAFMTRVPEHIPIGLEVPIRSALEAGKGIEASLSACLERARLF